MTGPLNAAGGDQPTFDDRLRYLVQRHRDPALESAYWDYREGLIDRRALFGSPAFAAAMRADAASLADQMRAEGITPDLVRERLVEALTEAGDYPPDDGQPDVVAPPADPPG